jgi:hypothetical protein
MANVFVEAKKYQKLHPKTAWQQCIQAVSGKKKTATKKAGTKISTKKSSPKKRAAVSGVKRKPAPQKVAAPRKIKLKIKPGKKGASSITIGSSRSPLSNDLRMELERKGLRNAKGYDVVKRSRISGISLQKITSEVAHLAALEAARMRHKEMLKERGLTASEKADIRRDIAKYTNNIKAAKAHIIALKRSI